MTCERCGKLEAEAKRLAGELADTEVALEHARWAPTYEDEYDELVAAVLDVERGVLDFADLLAKVNRRWAVAA